jgi:hypothetical protein
MAWEQRGNHFYYYQKERSGGRVRSVYVGRGEIASLTAALDGMQRKEQESKLLKQQQERIALKPLDAIIDAHAQLTTTLTEAVLIAGGFHQHNRQWRKWKV